MPQTDFRQQYLNLYSAFYSNPFIQQIGRIPKWTVSDKTKRPIDSVFLRATGKIRGAAKPYEQRTLSLDELTAFLPNAANHAFYLDCLEDGFMVLDIEPKCPSKLKRKLLSLPYIYGERSLSGHGYHLIFPMPKNFDQFPDAENRVVLKEDHGWYEILMNHWVTFTRSVIPSCSHPQFDFETLYAFLARKAEATAYSNASIEEVSLADISLGTRLVEEMIHQPPFYKKKLSDFGNDFSKYEFGLINFMIFKLNSLMKKIPYCLNTKPYSNSDKSAILYKVIKDPSILPHRDKHDTVRGGMPYLLYSINRALGSGKDRTS